MIAYTGIKISANEKLAPGTPIKGNDGNIRIIAYITENIEIIAIFLLCVLKLVIEFILFTNIS